MARLAFGSAKVVMPVSRALEMGIRRYGIRGRFRVIPNAVDVDLFRPGNWKPVHGAVRRFLFVGDLEPSNIKGLAFLFRALAELGDQNRTWLGS